MDLQMLLDAINDVVDLSNDTNAVERFNEITRGVPQVDRDDPPNILQICVPNDPPPGCTNQDQLVPGGRYLLNQIINALGGTAPADWFGPGMDTDNLPTDIGPAVTVITNAMAGDSASLLALHEAFAGANFFADLGFLPTYDHDNQALTPEIETGQNVGADALAYIIGGTGFVALETIALALDGHESSQDVLSLIFSYRNMTDPPPVPPVFTPCLPANQPCLGDASGVFLAALDDALDLPSPLNGEYGMTPSEVVRNAIAGNQGAQYLVNQLITYYLDGDPCSQLNPVPPGCTGAASDPNSDGYIGPPAVAFLESAISGLTGTIDTSTPPLPAPDPDIVDKPTTPPRDDEAVVEEDPACEVDPDDVVLTEGGSFSTDPCQWTRNTRSLDFAQNYTAGARWVEHVNSWIVDQWKPALFAMARELNAAIINQTRMIGSAIDAVDAAHTAVMIQKNELDVKRAVMPSELACTSGSGLAAGMDYSQSVANALRRSFKHELKRRANTGLAASPLLGP